MHDLGIVIVNWNTRDLLRRCLETIYASEGGLTCRVVVMDNASTDDSPQMVREHFPQVELVVSEVNGGFSYGNNLGLRALGFSGEGQVAENAPRYAMLLNPDTEVHPDALQKMVDFMDTRPEVGVVGPRLLLPDGTLDKACRRGLPTPMVTLYHFSGLARLFPRSRRFGRYNMTFASVDEELEVDSVVGACMLVRQEAVARVGLMDEAFFMYAEDIDWCYRVQQAGWKIWYYPDAVVYHIKRAASRRSQKAQFEFWRAMLIFYRKHFRKTTPFWLHILVLTGLLVKGGRGLWPEIRRPLISQT